MPSLFSYGMGTIRLILYKIFQEKCRCSYGCRYDCQFYVQGKIFFI